MLSRALPVLSRTVPFSLRFLVALLSTIFVGTALSAATYHVDGQNGIDDANTATGTRERPYKTIQAAINRAANNDTIVVRGGVYREAVEINGKNGLTLQPRPSADTPGAPYEGVVIQGALPVTGWTRVQSSDSDGSLVAQVGAGRAVYRSTAMTWTLDPGGKPGRDQLFVDGTMITLARHPNNPTNELLTPPRLALTGSTIPDYPTITTSPQQLTVHVAAGGFPTGNIVGAWMHQLGSGNNGQYGMGLTSRIDSAESTTTPGTVKIGVTLSTKWTTTAHNKTYYLPATGTAVFFEGALALLDGDWEWFRTSASASPRPSTLYLTLPVALDPATLQIEAKANLFGLRLRNADNNRILGLRFFACSLSTDSRSDNNLIEESDFLYPAHFGTVDRDPYRDGAQAITHGSQTIGDENEYTRAAAGLYFEGTGNTLRKNSIGYAAGSGVTLFGERNRAVNNLVHNVAYRGTDGAGVNVGGRGYSYLWNPSWATTVVNGNERLSASTPMSNNNAFIGFGSEVAHNTIYNASRALILIRGAYAADVHHNFLFHGMYNTTDYGVIYGLRNYRFIERTAEVTGTGGAITTKRVDVAVDGGGGMTRISRNLLHTTAPILNANSNALYIDNNSADYIIDHNVHFDRRSQSTGRAMLITATNSGSAGTVFGWSGMLIANNTMQHSNHVFGAGDEINDGIWANATGDSVHSPAFAEGTGAWYTTPWRNKGVDQPVSTGALSRLHNNISLGRSPFLWVTQGVAPIDPVTKDNWPVKITAVDQVDSRLLSYRPERAGPGLKNDTNRSEWAPYTTFNGIDSAAASTHPRSFLMLDKAGNDYRIDPTSRGALLRSGRSIKVRVPDTSLPRDAVTGRYPLKDLPITADGVTNPDLGAYEGGDWFAGAGRADPGVGRTLFPAASPFLRGANEQPYNSTWSGALAGAWSFVDIGEFPLSRPPGYTARFGDQFVVTGGGNGWRGNTPTFDATYTDSFHFLRRTNVGHGTLTATINYLEMVPSGLGGVYKNGDELALMIRENDTDTSRYVALRFYPFSRSLRFERRDADGVCRLSTVYTFPSLTLPLTLRLTRRLNVANPSQTDFVGEFSTDRGVTYTTHNTLSLSSFPALAHAGIAVTSGDDTRLSTVNLSRVQWTEPYAGWAARAGLSLAEQANPEKLQAYSFGATPAGANDLPAVLPRIEYDAARQRYTVTFLRRKNGITYDVQQSENLRDWLTLPAEQVLGSWDRGDDTEEVEYMATKSAPQLFFRVKTTQL